MFKRSDMFGKLSFTRHGRIEKYLENLEENISLSKKDREIVTEINDIINQRIKTIRKLNVILVFLYLGVYFSFVSFFFQEFYLLEQVKNFIRTLISIFGTTIFIVAIYFVQRGKDLAYGDLNLLTSHIIAIYNNKFSFKDQINTIKDKNDYEVFIAFFRKRGFSNK